MAAKRWQKLIWEDFTSPKEDFYVYSLLLYLATGITYFISSSPISNSISETKSQAYTLQVLRQPCVEHDDLHPPAQCNALNSWVYFLTNASRKTVLANAEMYFSNITTVVHHEMAINSLTSWPVCWITRPLRPDGSLHCQFLSQAIAWIGSRQVNHFIEKAGNPLKIQIDC